MIVSLLCSAFCFSLSFKSPLFELLYFILSHPTIFPQTLSDILLLCLLPHMVSARLLHHPNSSLDQLFFFNLVTVARGEVPSLLSTLEPLFLRSHIIFFLDLLPLSPGVHPPDAFLRKNYGR